MAVVAGLSASASDHTMTDPCRTNAAKDSRYQQKEGSKDLSHKQAHCHRQSVEVKQMMMLVKADASRRQMEMDVGADERVPTLQSRLMCGSLFTADKRQVPDSRQTGD